MPYALSVHRSGGSLMLIGIGLLLGSLDLAFACTYWKLLHGVAPARILQGIASGWLGTRAFAGGSATVWLGAALHYAIMLAMVFVYAAASRRLSLLTRRPWLCGPLYGLLLYAVMNGIVLPLSAATSTSMVPSWIVSSIMVHAWLIGLPIAWASRWAARNGAWRMQVRTGRAG